jgi:hypothetical protein
LDEHRRWIEPLNTHMQIEQLFLLFKEVLHCAMKSIYLIVCHIFAFEIHIVIILDRTFLSASVIILFNVVCVARSLQGQPDNTALAAAGPA